MRTIARPFDNFGSPISQWLFAGALTDTYGGRTLSLRAGTLRYGSVAPGIGGVVLDGSTLIGRTVSDAALRLTGDLTLHIMARLLTPAASLWLAGMLGSSISTSSTENHQWAIRLNAGGRGWEYTHERGSGVAETHGPVEWGVNFRTLLLSVRRASGVVQCFADGMPAGPPSAALTAPDGGSASEFLIGALQGASRINAIVGPCQIHDAAQSDAQIAEIWNRTLGRAYGRLIVEA